ncbi:site-2 protease family protein [Ruminococcaceae bacterium OttesenSCG-928-D13]|nr:site-2 protease family protein [Ruminococcaceae bacterium OttesenSCG-928-D13]
MNIVLTIIVAVLVFGAVIFFHELGHFIMAKTGKIKVNEFAIGMGPTLLKFGKGETTYALRALPIGGFVSMEGEDEESSDEHSFQRASIPRRLGVMVAGAFMNLVLGFLALVLLTSLGGQAIASREIASVENDSTGLRVGDVITKVNGRRAFIFDDLSYEFARTQNGTFDIEVKRDGKKVILQNITFDTLVAYDQETGEPIMNESTGEPYEYLNLGFKVWAQEKTFGSVIGEAFNTTLSYSRLIYLSLFDLITGKMPINLLSGPVGIVSEIGKAALLGWQSVIQLLALISVNLGVVNMLPLPALDGGRVILLMVEAIRHKPMPAKYESVINVAGFVLLMGLMVFVSFNDIWRLVT